jgi:hypothetical protein
MQVRTCSLQADHLVRSFVRNLRLLMRTACKYYCADQRQSFDAHLNVHRVDFNRLASAGKTRKIEHAARPTQRANA